MTEQYEDSYTIQDAASEVGVNTLICLQCGDLMNLNPNNKYAPDDSPVCHCGGDLENYEEWKSEHDREAAEEQLKGATYKEKITAYIEKLCSLATISLGCSSKWGQKIARHAASELEIFINYLQTEVRKHEEEEKQNGN